MTQQHSFADPDALMQRVSDMIEAGRLGVARPLLAAVKRLSPSPARLAELTARLAIGEGRLGDAEAELNAAVATAPDDRALRKRRAALRIQTGNLAGAAEDAAEAVILQRNDPAAKALLGVALMGLDQPEDAIQCLREAVAAEPNNPAFYQGLSTAEDAIGQAPAATATLDAGIQACPGSVGLRNAAIVHRLRSHDFGGAMALAEQAQRSGVADAWLHVLKGHTLSGLGRHLEAAEAYADALKLEPADPQIRHLAAASKARAESENEPGNYLRALFDGYAERFDGQLISLGYRVPGLFRAALLRILPRLRNGEPAGPVLDLGCGTGLVAVAVSDLPLRPMIGVDLSPAMLR
ncbi:MAG: tetratricopeptide repeat protein, partial [Acetobacteraceae bacterium]|nr:tetratricopeptide repeat protein [Acetobacteraceae bacterium]